MCFIGDYIYVEQTDSSIASWTHLIYTQSVTIKPVTTAVLAGVAVDSVFGTLVTSPGRTVLAEEVLEAVGEIDKDFSFNAEAFSNKPHRLALALVKGVVETLDSFISGDIRPANSNT